MSWGKPVDDTVKEQVTETEDHTENETGMTKEEKESRRYQREDIKFRILQLAHNKDDPPQTVVERAKAYYSFVTGKKVRS